MKMRFLGGIKLHVVFKPLVLFMFCLWASSSSLDGKCRFFCWHTYQVIYFFHGVRKVWIVFFFFPFKKIKNHHLRTAFCIYSVYLAPGCLMLEFVQCSETCKCLNMQNQKGALSVCVFSLWLVVICVQESTQSGWSRRGEIIDGHVSLTGCWEELSVGIKEGEKRNCQKGDLREVEAKNKREET